MNALLLFAMLQVVPADTTTAPIDTARATAELAISFEPGSIVVRGDTTLVFVGVQHEGDSTSLAAVDRASLALQAAILRQEPQTGPPNWVYAGALAVAAGWVLAYAFRTETNDVIVTQTVDTGSGEDTGTTTTGTTTTTTTTGTTTTGFCFPPGHCRKKHRPGGDDDE